ncbi:MAG: DUF3592 domain-containing protein [Planctomycetota bacterium]
MFVSWLNSRQSGVALTLLLSLAMLTWGGRDLILGGYQIYLGSASKQWPQVTATITTSKVVARSGKHGTSCKVETEYDFEVENIGFHGETLQYGQPPRDCGDAQRLAAKYPVGSKVSAHYCPENPELSVIEPGGNVNLTASTLFGSVFFVVGIIGLRLTLILWKNEQP